jgi:hypothetical protein
MMMLLYRADRGSGTLACVRRHREKEETLGIT